MVQGFSYIVIRKIFDLWIHSLCHNCSYQRSEFLAPECMALLAYLCFILINYLILKQHIVLVSSINFDISQRSAKLWILNLIGLFRRIQHVPPIGLFYKNGEGCGVHYYQNCGCKFVNHICVDCLTVKN